MKRLSLLSLLILSLCLSISCASYLSNVPEAHGPKNGTLIIAGGSNMGDDIMNRFIELAGGKDAYIIIIPTAGGEKTYDQTYRGREMFTSRGAENLYVLHTLDPAEADTDNFTEQIKKADGVWIPGGRQWRLADSYLGTKTVDELNNLLKRGGVIGGTSAGASIQASYMVRGAPEGNQIMMAEGHEEGFGFLQNAAVDQHIDARDRFTDMYEVIQTHPELLGIGLYESTAIEVTGDVCRVIGRGKVAFYDNRLGSYKQKENYFELEVGQKFNLKQRKIIK